MPELTLLYQEWVERYGKTATDEAFAWHEAVTE